MSTKTGRSLRHSRRLLGQGPTAKGIVLGRARNKTTGFMFISRLPEAATGPERVLARKGWMSVSNRRGMFQQPP